MPITRGVVDEKTVFWTEMTECFCAGLKFGLDGKFQQFTASPAGIILFVTLTINVGMKYKYESILNDEGISQMA